MNRYEKFKKMENKTYSEVNRYLKSTTHLTAREWMIARLCADFKNVSDHSEMTWIGENLPDIVPFAESPYSRQEVSNAHSAFKKKVRRSGTTFFYAYYAGLINQEEMLTMIHSMIGDIGELLKIEGGELSESHSEEVQLLIAQVLKNINEADGFED